MDAWHRYGDGRAARVLVVDDHDGMRVLLAMMLQRRGSSP